MKDARFELEFTSHVLANSTNAQGQKDYFQRDGDNNLIFQQSWFYAAFTKAIDLTRVKGVKANDISMDLTVKAPTQLYNRKYGEDNYREHEAIMPGTVVIFNAMVSDIITETTLRNLLEKMGTYIGLSPYGHNLGFGHFRVKSVTVAPSDAAELVR